MRKFRWFRCGQCKHEFRRKVDEYEEVKCPRCIDVYADEAENE